MKEILKGVYNHHVKGETELSESRMKICMAPDDNYEDKKCHKEDVVFGYRCKECGCVLKYKVKSDEGCPIKKW